MAHLGQRKGGKEADCAGLRPLAGGSGGQVLTIADACGASLTGFEPSLAAQDAQGLAQGGAADAHLVAQLALRGQVVLPRPGADGVPDFFGGVEGEGFSGKSVHGGGEERGSVRLSREQTSWHWGTH